MTKRKLYHVVNGLWAGIPWCCIKFWNDGNNGRTRKHNDPWARKACYVRCDACIARKHFIKIRKNGAILKGLLGYSWDYTNSWWMKI